MNSGDFSKNFLKDFPEFKTFLDEKNSAKEKIARELEDASSDVTDLITSLMKRMILKLIILI